MIRVSLVTLFEGEPLDNLGQSHVDDQDDKGADEGKNLDFVGVRVPRIVKLVIAQADSIDYSEANANENKGRSECSCDSQIPL